MKNNILKAAFIFLLLPSCVIKSPKYTSVKQVMTLEVGMKQAEVERLLNLKPYDVKSKTDTTNTFVYVYRLNDRRTFLNTKPVNGKDTRGKYVPLAVTYSKKDSVVLSMESCSLCDDDLMSVSKLDVQKVVAFFTVTAPALLIYLGLRSAN